MLGMPPTIEFLKMNGHKLNFVQTIKMCVTTILLFFAPSHNFTVIVECYQGALFMSALKD